MTSCVVAMLTYRRPDDLVAAVPALLAEIGEQADLLIVDNDPDGGAREQVLTWSADPRVHYLHEPQPGIAAARNAALSWARSLDTLVFIDDDERPEPGWLAALLATYERTRPAAVVGPVRSEFDGDLPAFIEAGRFFERRRWPTGTRVPGAATNNLLLDLAVIRRHGLAFDERYSLTGGSDALFTRQLTAAGESIVWCDEARVIDRVPVGRLSTAWVLQKAYRIGNTTSRVSLDLTTGRLGRARVRAGWIARGGARVLIGAAMATAGAVGRRLPLHARGRRLLARGRGMVAGAVGALYSEYSRPAA